MHSSRLRSSAGSLGVRSGTQAGNSASSSRQPSARGGPSTGSARRSPASPGSPKRSASGPCPSVEEAGNNRKHTESAGGLSHAGSQSESLARKPSEPTPQGFMELFAIIQQLAVSEAALWSILDGLKSNVSYVSFFCREYWGTSGSQAPLSIERLDYNERLKRQVQQACVMEVLSMGVVAHLCSGVMPGVTVTIQSRLRNLLYYIHENVLVLMDLVCQRWLNEAAARGEQPPSLYCPENLNFDILVRVRRYRRLQRGAHLMALRQHNEMIANLLRQLCRGTTSKRPAATPGHRSPGSRDGGRGPQTVLALANDVLSSRTPLDRMRASSIRSKMAQCIRFAPLLSNGNEPDCPWPSQDPYVRFGSHRFAADAPPIWFEPLPPMYPDLDVKPVLPPVAAPDTYTLVLDLDETLVHYFEEDGMGNFNIRPGMHEFLQRMHSLGYEIVVFTAATQDYADWVMDQIDPESYIRYRLYRQHALPWGPIFIKDLSVLGRDLERTLIIDNVQENFMLQPSNGIFILSWYEDRHDTALYSLSPMLDELIRTRVRVPDLLDKYADQVPVWAGVDQFGPDYPDFVHDGDGLLQPSYSTPVPEASTPPPPPPPPPVPPTQLQQSHSAPCATSYYSQSPAVAATPNPSDRPKAEPEAVRSTPPTSQLAAAAAAAAAAVTPATPAGSPPVATVSYASGGTQPLGGYPPSTAPPSPAYLRTGTQTTTTACPQACQATSQIRSDGGTLDMSAMLLQVGGPAPPRAPQRGARQPLQPKQQQQLQAATNGQTQPTSPHLHPTAPYHTVGGVTGPGPAQVPMRQAAPAAGTTMTPASSPCATTRAAPVAQSTSFFNRSGFGPHQVTRR